MSNWKTPKQKLNMRLLPTDKSLYIWGNVMFRKAGPMLMRQARAHMGFFLLLYLEIGLVLESQ